MVNRDTLTVSLNLAPQTLLLPLPKFVSRRLQRALRRAHEPFISPLRWSQQWMPPRWWVILADLSIFISRAAWAYLNKSLAVAHQNQAKVLRMLPSVKKRQTNRSARMSHWCAPRKRLCSLCRAEAETVSRLFALSQLRGRSADCSVSWVDASCSIYCTNLMPDI